MENSVPLLFCKIENEYVFLQLLSEQKGKLQQRKSKKIVQYCNMKKMYFLRK